MATITNFGESLPDRKTTERKETTKKASKPRAAMSFQSWKYRATRVIFIAKKGDKMKTPLFSNFSSFDDSRAFIAENYELLCEKWAETQKQMSILDADIRINSENVTSAIDFNVTPEQIMREFAPRGVEFGDWVNNDERQMMLNRFYVAMLDLEKITGVSPAVWLSGLGVAFGDRGQGRKASAHYEPTNHVINLTKMSGAGCLFHELLHSADVNITKLAGNALSKQELCLPKIPEWDKRCNSADASKSKKYWSTHCEKLARAFESYCLYELESMGMANEYGVGIKPVEQFSKGLESYPYLLREEMPAIKAFFDGVFADAKNARAIELEEIVIDLPVVEQSKQIEATPAIKPTKNSMTEVQGIANQIVTRLGSFIAQAGDYDTATPSVKTVAELLDMAKKIIDEKESIKTDRPKIDFQSVNFKIRVIDSWFNLARMLIVVFNYDVKTGAIKTTGGLNYRKTQSTPYNPSKPAAIKSLCETLTELDANEQQNIDLGSVNKPAKRVESIEQPIANAAEAIEQQEKEYNCWTSTKEEKADHWDEVYASEMRYEDGSTVKDRIDKMVIDGFNEVVSKKVGAVFKYAMANRTIGKQYLINKHELHYARVVSKRCTTNQAQDIEPDKSEQLRLENNEKRAVIVRLANRVLDMPCALPNTIKDVDRVEKYRNQGDIERLKKIFHKYDRDFLICSNPTASHRKNHSMKRGFSEIRRMCELSVEIVESEAEPAKLYEPIKLSDTALLAKLRAEYAAKQVNCTSTPTKIERLLMSAQGGDLDAQAQLFRMGYVWNDPRYLNANAKYMAITWGEFMSDLTIKQSVTTGQQLRAKVWKAKAAKAIEIVHKAIQEIRRRDRYGYELQNGEKLWYEEKWIIDALQMGVNEGFIFRRSHTQVEWTQKGVDSITKPAKAKSYRVHTVSTTYTVKNCTTEQEAIDKMTANFDGFNMAHVVSVEAV